MNQDGEIPFLDADPLHESIQAPAYEEEVDPDERAIRAIASKLRKKGGRTEEAIEEMAVSLYNKICQSLRSSGFASDRIKDAAELFDEEPDELLRRLRASE